MAGRREVDDLLVLHLAAGTTVEAAAELAGCSRATAHRRLQDPKFRQRVRDARGSMIERAVGHMTAGAVDASATLRNLLESSNEKIQLAAARSILELLTRVRETGEIEERLASLENRAAARRHRKGMLG
jgi:hypothetical protein